MKRKEVRMVLTGIMMLITAMFVTPCSPAWAKGPQVAAGGFQTVGLKSDGTVVTAGNNDGSQTDVSSWTGIGAVAAGYLHTVGLKSDGTVVAAGLNNYGQADVTEAAWTNIVAVSAGVSHTVGLKSAGTVVAVGDTNYGQTDVSSWTGIVAVAAGASHTVGLKSDGTVLAVGDNTYGQRDVSSWGTDISITAISAGASHTVGLRSDGTVVAAGSNSNNQLNVTGSDWTDIIAIAAGTYHTLGLKSDGTVVAAGNNVYGQTNVTGAAWTNIVAVAAGPNHTLGLKSDGTVVVVGDNTYGQTDVSSWWLQTTDMDVSYARGTQAVLQGSGFGWKKGSVHVGTTATQPILWSDTMIVFEMTASLAPGKYPISVTPKGGTPVTYGKSFVMKAPEVQMVQVNTGYVKDMVMLTGKYFGSKKGKVFLGAKSCPVSYWYMDPTNGKSTAVFQIPKTTVPGSYNISVTNKAGSGRFPAAAFTVKSGTGLSAGHEELLPDQEE